MAGPIAERLSARGVSWGCSSQIDVTPGRVLYTADAYCNGGRRFTVIADDRLTAFLELERVTHESLRFQIPNDSTSVFATIGCWYRFTLQ
jgi:hypothetical protein